MLHQNVNAAPPAGLQPQSFEDQIYCAVVERGDACYDIGANIGDVSLLLSRLSGPDGQVVAFEPVWPVYATLCQEIQRRPTGGGPITTVPLGLAQTDREATIQVPNGSFPMGSLAPAERWATVLPDQTIDSYQCRFTTLDRFLAQSGLPVPDFVKIDVEGAELFVLDGAADLLERGHRPLMLIEVFAPWERTFDYGPWDVLGRLKALGYQFLFACPEGLVPHDPVAEDPFPPQYEQGYNVVVHHPPSHRSRIERLAGLHQDGGEPILDMPVAPVPNRIDRREP